MWGLAAGSESWWGGRVKCPLHACLKSLFLGPGQCEKQLLLSYCDGLTASPKTVSQKKLPDSGFSSDIWSL